MKYIKALFAVLSLAIAGSAFALDKKYETISPAQATSSGDKIEILEFFWYGCPHCYQFEPFVENWLKTKPANVEFIKVPAFRDNHTRAYYAAQLLGVEHKFSTAFFKALNDERKRLNSQKQVAEFAQNRLGISFDDFMDAMNSFAVETKLRRAKQLANNYRLEGVPTVIINGKYITDAGMAKGHAGVLRVVDQLIAQESK